MPDGCDVWLGFYIFPHIIIANNDTDLLWVRRDGVALHLSPLRNLGVKRHDKASSPHPNLAATAECLLESPTRFLTGPELEATIVTSGYEERVVAASYSAHIPPKHTSCHAPSTICLENLVRYLHLQSVCPVINSILLLRCRIIGRDTCTRQRSRAGPLTLSWVKVHAPLFFFCKNGRGCPCLY